VCSYYILYKCWSLYRTNASRPHSEQHLLNTNETSCSRYLVIYRFWWIFDSLSVYRYIITHIFFFFLLIFLFFSFLLNAAPFLSPPARRPATIYNSEFLLLLLGFPAVSRARWHDNIVRQLLHILLLCIMSCKSKYKWNDFYKTRTIGYYSRRLLVYCRTA